MSFIKISGANVSDAGSLTGTVASEAVTKDTLMMPDRTSKKLTAATSSTATTDTVFLARETVANTATSIKVELVNPYDLYLADCTANTAATQLFIRHALTDAATVNNTTTDSAVNEGVFEALAIYGAASDKKLIGRLIFLGQDADVS